MAKDKKGTPRRVIQGHWGKRRLQLAASIAHRCNCFLVDKSIEMAKVVKHDKNAVETGAFQRIWTINPP